MNIGNKIRKLREDKLMSQNELAMQLGISQTTLHNIESGNPQKIDALIIAKMCNLFDKDFSYFVDDSFSQTNKDNKNSAISIFGNPIVNNNYPESILLEIQNLIEENKFLKAKIAELEK